MKGAYNSGVTITKRREGRANKYEAIYNTNNELIYKKRVRITKSWDILKVQVKQETGI